MANEMKGEVDWEVDGKTYVLRYSYDTLAQMETKLGKGLPVIARELADPDKLTLGMVREIIYFGLKEYHKDVTLVEVGDLISRYGSILKTMRLLDKALTASFDDKEEEAKENPPKEAAPPK